MVHGFGVDPIYDANGKVIQGTTTEDIRRITAGLFSPGLISGGLVYASNSSMTYEVSAGVACVVSSSGQNILIPIPATTLTVPPTTGLGRQDTIWVNQRYAASGAVDVVVVASYQGQNLPTPGAVILKIFNITGAATNTSSAIQAAPVTYSIPYGGSLGTLHTATDTWNGPHDQTIRRLGNGTIYVPTDRRLRITINTILYSVGAAGFDNSKYVEWVFQPEIDGTKLWDWNTPGLHGAWALYTFTGYFNVEAGQHTVSYSRGKIYGNGTAGTAYGMQNGRFFPGTEFVIEDAGVVQ